MKNKIFIILNAARRIVSHNIALKILSFLLAMMLWSYIVSSNASITRTKTIAGIQGYINGQMTLEMNNLALVTDAAEALGDITVEVEVPLASYSYPSSDNVQVSLDLSSVRTTGTQDVPLKATSTYGTVTRVYPSSIELTFEPLDSRSIPVNVQLDGQEDGYWYNCLRTNPSQITISGATSVVQDVSSVVVRADMSGRYSSFNTSCIIELLDASGSALPSTNLNLSASSVSLNMEVYPTRELEVSTATDDILLGQVAPGYIIEAITVQPSTITVAAEQELLDSIDRLVIEPIEIDQPSQSFTRRASISGLSDFRYISNEQVYVNVQIAEETISDWIEDVDITFVGLEDGLAVTQGRGTVAVHVTGPRSRVEALTADTLSVTVDLATLDAGTYELPVVADTTNYPAMTFEVDPARIQVTIEAEIAQ